MLSEISDRWLARNHAAERRFSVAGFEPRFVGAQSAALLSQHGKPIAFVTFMTTDLQTEATVGLMRQVPGAPPCTMECLFTQLALELKARGFKRLSLGMAPLAGMSRAPLSSEWHRLAGAGMGAWQTYLQFSGSAQFQE